MALFAIGDLHLPGHLDKPMDVFGQHWDRHFDSISENWTRLITKDDTVLIPGDVSWAMQMPDAMDDLYAIAALPGRKLILRGNHDYWWSSISKLRSALPEGMYAVQNDAIVMPEAIICGTRGWNVPLEGEADYQNDDKIYQRELLRLRMSLDAAQRLKAKEDKPIVAMLHFPPIYQGLSTTGFSDILEEYQVPYAVYGHLHGAGIKNGFNGEHGGTRYQLASCDALGFCPIRIMP